LADRIDNAGTRAEAESLVADLHPDDVKQVARELGIDVPARMSADATKAHVVQSVLTLGNAGALDHAAKKATPSTPHLDGPAEVAKVISSDLTPEGKRRILTNLGVPEDSWPESLRPAAAKVALTPTAKERTAAGFPDVPPGVDVTEDAWMQMSYSERLQAIMAARPDAKNPDGLDAYEGPRLKSYAAEFLDSTSGMDDAQLRAALRAQGVGSPEVEHAKRVAEEAATPKAPSSKVRTLADAQLDNKVLAEYRAWILRGRPGSKGGALPMESLRRGVGEMSPEDFDAAIERLKADGAVVTPNGIHIANPDSVPLPARDWPPLSVNPAERMAQIQYRIEQTYQELAIRKGGFAGFVQLADVRDRLGPDVSKADFDRAVIDMSMRPGVMVPPESNQKTLTPHDRASVVSIGNQDRHLIRIEDTAGGARPKGEGPTAIRSSADWEPHRHTHAAGSDAEDPMENDEEAKARRSRQLAMLDTRAAGHDVTPGHDELHHWWTKGPGLARWIGSRHQYATLHAELVKATKGKLPPGEIDRMAASWVHEVTGFWPGSDMHRVLEGGKPRGNRIGRG
jgi:hypothetical protein